MKINQALESHHHANINKNITSRELVLAFFLAPCARHAYPEIFLLTNPHLPPQPASELSDVTSLAHDRGVLQKRASIAHVSCLEYLRHHVFSVPLHRRHVILLRVTLRAFPRIMVWIAAVGSLELQISQAFRQCFNP